MKLASHLPALETCLIEGVQSLDAKRLKLESFHFKTVRIHQSCLGFHTLAHVIRSCEGLLEFEYSLGSFQAGDQLYGLDLLRALSDYAETLRVLNLDLGAQRTVVTERYTTQIYGEATGLPDFSAITHLSLGMDLLLCVARGNTDGNNADVNGHFLLMERLPPQLECLTIYRYMPGMNALWDRLLEELREMIVDGDGSTVFTLRGVDEYLRHPSSTETEEEDEVEEESSEEDEHD